MTITETQMVWLVIAAIYTGLILATGIIGTIVYDLIAIQKGWRTVSEETYLLSNKSRWVGIILTGVVCLAVGILIGHLFFPQIFYVHN